MFRNSRERKLATPSLVHALSVNNKNILYATVHFIDNCGYAGHIRKRCKKKF